MELSSYEKVCEEVLPGDVIAFLGGGALSKFFSAGSDVSHAGIIVGRRGERGEEPTFVEATIRLSGSDATTRVMESSFRERCTTYDGEVWWLPMDPAVRERFDRDAFVGFIREAIGRPFDPREGLITVLREWYDQLLGEGLEARVEEEAFFCSELVAEALQRAGVVELRKASLIHPADICAWKIYARTYFHLRGEGKEIPEYNQRTPGSFLRDGTR